MCGVLYTKNYFVEGSSIFEVSVCHQRVENVSVPACEEVGHDVIRLLTFINLVVRRINSRKKEEKPVVEQVEKEIVEKTRLNKIKVRKKLGCVKIRCRKIRWKKIKYENKVKKAKI